MNKLQYILIVFGILFISSVVEVAGRGDFSPYTGDKKADDSDDDNVLKQRAQRSAKIHIAASQTTRETGPVESDDDSDDAPKRGRVLPSQKVDDESDDMKDADPALKATLKALEKRFIESFGKPGANTDATIDFEKIKQILPGFKKQTDETVQETQKEAPEADSPIQETQKEVPEVDSSVLESSQNEVKRDEL